MHSLDDNCFDDGANWREWNDEIAESIDDTICSFLASLIGRDILP